MTSHIPIPPDQLQALVGSQTPSSFVEIGENFKNFFVGSELISESYKVLEPGCGCARVAAKLVDILNVEYGGEFYGFDVHKHHIDWATENISSIHSNFHFLHTDVHNSLYNPDGRYLKPVKEVFPYEENFFDFTYATSFFTHLQKEHLEFYIELIHRFMKRGGSVYSTFFCYDDIGDFEKLSADWTGEETKYSKVDEVSYTYSKASPALVVTYQREYLLSLLRSTGFEIIESPVGWQSGWLFEKK